MTQTSPKAGNSFDFNTKSWFPVSSRPLRSQPDLAILCCQHLEKKQKYIFLLILINIFCISWIVIKFVFLFELCLVFCSCNHICTNLQCNLTWQEKQKCTNCLDTVFHVPLNTKRKSSLFAVIPFSSLPLSCGCVAMLLQWQGVALPSLVLHRYFHLPFLDPVPPWENQLALENNKTRSLESNFLVSSYSI